MRDFRLAAATIPLVVLVACAGSSKSLTEQTKPIVHSYTDEYRVIFDRVSSTAKQCWTTSVLYTSQHVESDLYPTLNYGQVSMVFGDAGMETYVFTARIEKTASGSTMTIHSQGGASKYLIRDAVRWADGDLSCG